MVGHIGIVGCSAEGAALCYRTISVEGAAVLGQAHAHPEVTMHTPSLARYVACLGRGDLDGVAELMLASARILAAAGADFLISPDNTIHSALPRVVDRSPLPWVSIVDVVAEEGVRRGFRRLGILGTEWLLASDIYPQALARHQIESVTVDGPARRELGRVIMDELVMSRFEPASVDWLRTLVEGLKGQGCDAVVLGCTELPLVLDDANAAVPTLDSTRLLARAALQRAVGAHPGA